MSMTKVFNDNGGKTSTKTEMVVIKEVIFTHNQTRADHFPDAQHAKTCYNPASLYPLISDSSKYKGFIKLPVAMTVQ